MARRETGKTRVQALVVVGDAMEESVDALSTTAGELGMLGVPIFVFQEGADAVVEQAFREMARLSHGAYCRFSPGSAHELGECCAPPPPMPPAVLAALRISRNAKNAGASGCWRNEIAMPTVLIGLAVLVLVLWVLNGFAKAMSKDWHTAPVLDAALPRWRRPAAGAFNQPKPTGFARGARFAAGVLALACAAFLGAPWTDPDRCRTCAHRRRTASAGFRGIRFNSVNAIRGAAVKSRASARLFWRWSSITIPARCMGASSRVATPALPSTRSNSRL